VSEVALLEMASRYEEIIASYSSIKSRDAQEGVRAARESVAAIHEKITTLRAIDEKIAAISAEFDARGVKMAEAAAEDELRMARLERLAAEAAAKDATSA
jgi:hypothetical protein